jgi:sugar transferase (PEP-CTERM/EpsH1 system associated)
MNLLFLTPSLPHPPTQGADIRNWGIISSLSKNHRISLVTFASQSDDISKALFKCCSTIKVVTTPERNMLQRLSTMILSNKPDMSVRLKSAEYSINLQDVLATETLDLIQIEGLEMGTYLTDILDYYHDKTHRPTIIYDAHNAETVIQRRAIRADISKPKRWATAFYSMVQLRRIRAFELETCSNADTVICVSHEDSTALKKLCFRLNPTVLPNGIFLSDYPETTRHAEITPPALVFSGKMDYRPNIDAAVWFANEVFPLIQNKHDDAKFIIVGQSPTRQVLNLAKRPGITVTGDVDDIRPYIAAATVCVVPLRMGGGTRLKILEAMALSKPIVSTTIGAEGFPVTDGKEILIADTPQDLVRAIDSLLCRDYDRALLGKAGRTFVSNNYQWKAIMPIVEKLYNRTSI